MLRCSRALLLGAPSTSTAVFAACNALPSVSALCSHVVQFCLQVCPWVDGAACAAPSRVGSRAGYVESVRDVVSALSDTILFEAGGASEREVRRKADPAKASIERFLRDWKGSPVVSSQPSYAALVGASCA